MIWVRLSTDQPPIPAHDADERHVGLPFTFMHMHDVHVCRPDVSLEPSPLTHSRRRWNYKKCQNKPFVTSESYRPLHCADEALSGSTQFQKAHGASVADWDGELAGVAKRDREGMTLASRPRTKTICSSPRS